MAMWALSSYYGQKNVVASGPIPVGSRITEGAVVIKFSHANGGLRAQDGGELKGFAITGADGRWVWGHAKTDADTVIVSSPEIKDPLYVRYAWASNPADANLINGHDLPATPFRTDNEHLTNAYMR
ncbi:MAG: hypothetical protein GX804_03800 [Lentisphaerae bacterium]|nr:hypothetical protein [Lentisphaerota bacterium]